MPDNVKYHERVAISDIMSMLAEVKAPANIKIGGEHSVVYGGPSLSAAISLYATSTVEVNHAYSVLREKRSKERYDAEHSRGESAMGRAQFSASIDMMLASYYNKRKRTIDEFNSRVSSPMDPDSLNSAIDSVLSWSGIFDSAKTEVYGTMLEAIGRIEHNTYTGKKLLESGTVADGTLHDRLRESVEQLVVMKQQCDALRKGVYSAISEAKKRVAEQEAEIARSTHRV